MKQQINTNGVLKTRVSATYDILSTDMFVGKYVIIGYPSLHEILSDFISYVMYYGIYNRDKVDLLSIYKTQVIPYLNLYIKEEEDLFKNINRIIVKYVESLTGDIKIDYDKTVNLITEIEGFGFPNIRINAVLEKKGKKYTILSHETDEYGFVSLYNWLLSNNIIEEENIFESLEEEHTCSCGHCNCDDTINLKGRWLPAPDAYAKFFSLSETFNVYGLGITNKDICVYANSYNDVLPVRLVYFENGVIRLEKIEHPDKPLSSFTSINEDHIDIMISDIKELFKTFSLEDLHHKLSKEIFMWFL